MGEPINADLEAGWWRQGPDEFTWRENNDPVDRRQLKRMVTAGWVKALRSPECGSRYSDHPCRARTCREGDEWCEQHKRLREVAE